MPGFGAGWIALVLFAPLLAAAQVQSPGEAPPEPPTLHDLRTRILSTDQVLLELEAGAEGGSVRLVSQDRERRARIEAGADSLRALSRELLASLERADDGGPAARELYRRILGPVAPDLPPGARLVFVAGPPFADLPFAALRDEGGWLIERHPLSVIGTLDEIRTERGARPSRPRAPADLTPQQVEEFLASNGVTLRRPPGAPPAAEAPLLQDLARGLEQRLPPDVALQRAQLRAIAAGRPPREWALYAVQGRMAAPRVQGKFPLWLVGVGLAVGARVVLAALRLTEREGPAEKAA